MFKPSKCTVCSAPIMIKAGKGNHKKLCEQHRGAKSVAVSRVSSASGARPVAIVPATPQVTPRGPSSGTQGPLAQEGRFGEAVAIITESMAKGEGYRHGWLGNTGTGKTVGIQALLDATAGTFTLIHDDTKLEAQYNVAPGAVVSDFWAAPDGVNTVLFRGDVFRETVVEVEPVAALARKIAMVTRKPVRLVVDELDRACSLGGKELAAPTLRTCMTQGRSMGISVVWSTQAPQRMPREIIDQSSTIAICQLGPRALNYLDERLCFDKEFLEIVPTLKTFEFVLYENGKPWNKVVYRSPLPKSRPVVVGPPWP